MTQRLIFGCGTGRCGTASLTKLLNYQAGTQVTHEINSQRRKGTEAIREYPSWHGSSDNVFRNAMRIITGRDAEVVGDVAHFWIEYVPMIVVENPTVRVVCLVRPREEVVRSIAFKFSRERKTTLLAGSLNQVGINGSSPYFEAQTEAEAAGMYWDWYSARADQMTRAYPEHFKIFETADVLCSGSVQRDMLVWAGFSAPNIHAGIHLNRTTDPGYV